MSSTVINTGLQVWRGLSSNNADPGQLIEVENKRLSHLCHTYATPMPQQLHRPAFGVLPIPSLAERHVLSECPIYPGQVSPDCHQAVTQRFCPNTWAHDLVYHSGIKQVRCASGCIYTTADT